MAQVPCADFYATYHGHDPRHLDVVLASLRREHRNVIFLAGDSSLDNKYWCRGQKAAVNGYERVLAPPRMKADVCFWLNTEAANRGERDLCCINTAVEATALSNRAFGNLLAQDQFIADNISAEDYLIVSVGGNDIALMPTLCTVTNILLLSWCTPVACLNCACACPPNLGCDGGCWTCGLEGCLAGFCCGWPPGLGYFVDMFRNKVGNYVNNLVARTKPKKVVICMIYYLDEVSRGGWADCALKCMCYDAFPSRLQTAIAAVYDLATRSIEIPGTEVVAFPLFRVLNGKQPADYVDRVEPSERGGRKMAVGLLDAVLGIGDPDQPRIPQNAPEQVTMGFAE